MKKRDFSQIVNSAKRISLSALATLLMAGTIIVNAPVTAMAANCTHENTERKIVVYHESPEVGYCYALTEVCKECGSGDFIVRNIAPDTNEVVQPGSCYGNKIYHFTISYEYEGETYTSEDYVNDDPLGHDWGEWSEQWADDYSSLTLSRVCKRDSEHTQEYTSTDITPVLTGAPTCASNEILTYTASFESFYLGDTIPKTVSKNVEIPNSKNENNHVGETTVKDAKPATCKEEGYTGDTVCDSCGVVITAGSVIEKADHNWNAGEITTPATCKNKGVKTFTCLDCGETKTEDIAIDPSAHTPVVVSAVDATCISTGLSEGSKCSACGEVIKKQETIAAKGHSFGEWEQITSPTCNASGSEKRVCSVCGYTETKDIDGGHSWNSDYTIDKDSTCTEEGSKSIHCKNCDAVKDSTVIEKKEHSWNSSYTVDKNATCTESGAESIHCEKCDAIKETKEIAPLGHSYTNQTVDGVIKEVCVRCGHIGKTIDDKKPDDKPDDKKPDDKPDDKKPDDNKPDDKKPDDNKPDDNPGDNNPNPGPDTNVPNTPVVPTNPYGDTQIESIVDGEAAYTVSTKYQRYLYTGKAIKPGVTIRDEEGNVISKKNYKVAYSDNVNVGIASIKITMTGDYAGTVLLQNFYIVPKSTTISKLSQINNGIQVTWKKQATQTTGYQIQYSTNKRFKSYKTMTVISAEATTKQIMDLVPGTKYYVRIRTFSGDITNRIYSNWSASKAITLK